MLKGDKVLLMSRKKTKQLYFPQDITVKVPPGTCCCCNAKISIFQVSTFNLPVCHDLCICGTAEGQKYTEKRHSLFTTALLRKMRETEKKSEGK